MTQCALLASAAAHQIVLFHALLHQLALTILYCSDTHSVPLQSSSLLVMWRPWGMLQALQTGDTPALDSLAVLIYRCCRQTSGYQRRARRCGRTPSGRRTGRWGRPRRSWRGCTAAARRSRMTAMMMWRAALCPTTGGHHRHAMSPCAASTVTPGEWRAVRGTEEAPYSQITCRCFLNSWQCMRFWECSGYGSCMIIMPSEQGVILGSHAHMAAYAKLSRRPPSSEDVGALEKSGKPERNNGAR